MKGYLLDTHVLLWISRRANDEVSRGFFEAVEQWHADRSVFVSAVSSWEIGLLVAGDKLDVGGPVQQFWDSATKHDGFPVLALSPSILIASTRLPGTIHRDPSDRMLAATAREHGLTLVTRDQPLLDYAKQGHLSARKP